MFISLGTRGFAKIWENAVLTSPVRRSLDLGKKSSNTQGSRLVENFLCPIGLINKFYVFPEHFLYNGETGTLRPGNYEKLTTLWKRWLCSVNEQTLLPQ